MGKTVVRTQGKPVTVIVKPISDCNLNCVYCYEAKSPYQHMRMDYDTLRNTITKFARHNGPSKRKDSIHLAWR